MRRQWLKLFVIGVAAIAVTGVAATLRIANPSKQFLRTPVHQTKPLRANGADSSEVASQTDTHIVRLLSPADAQFDLTLESNYPRLSINASFQALRQNTVLISNDSGQPIHAFVIKWTLQTGKGTSTVTYDPYLKSAGRDQLVTQGVVLAPNEVRLLSPSFAFQKGQSLGAVAAQMSANLTLKQDIVVASSLDGVIFEDGVFVGIDEAKLVDHFECERSAQHDEGFSMRLLLNKQATDQELTEKLNEYIHKGRAYRAGSDRESLYFVARGNEAQLLLQLLKQAGRTKFEQAVTRLAKMSPTKLRRV